ncbi:glutamine synthetase family protein [Marinilabilia rubra]|uniref:Glutamine synthetase n=1 Tax=Marinilabilia rubra TaxID=2162893 RepID=A0A2U2BCR1_9BACT|nr:glutamine synthetase family protein [Marinilabilia rubra]PWE00817.1 glutamine synthetase [Marinilabilia rubra]
MEKHYDYSPNPLVKYIKKEPSQFTREDIISFMTGNQIRLLNFRYPGEDGRLKTLNFAIHSQDHLKSILTHGERVDGSSLFSFMETGSSDLYVVPRYQTAFLNPFSEIPSMEILCSFFNHNGELLDLAPENILRKAANQFRQCTGMDMLMLGELEYYVNSPTQSLFPATDQRGYHESQPFAKFEWMRKEALRLMAECGGQIKYGHSEVGNFTKGEEAFEQHEIEFLPTTPETAADQILIAKWILRMLAEESNVEISFAPKISTGKAGNGLHFHMLLTKDGQNIVMENRKLSDSSKKIIAGILDMADALTAFGNTLPTSYLRLVPNQEAPTYICWGERNRSALVRIPLGWTSQSSMAAAVNPADGSLNKDTSNDRQTFEFRVPDGSADIHLIMAGIINAAIHGLNMKDALKKAGDLYVNGNIFNNNDYQKLNQLPASCYESAERLEKKKHHFIDSGIFPDGIINHTINKLRSFNDKNLREEMVEDNEKSRDLVIKYIHCQ